MTKPEIIGSAQSSYTRVARMVCDEKGIDYTLTEVPLGRYLETHAARPSYVRTIPPPGPPRRAVPVPD
jgi:glutathione S-transferase